MMQQHSSIYSTAKPTERVRTILNAVSKHVTLQQKPELPFLADANIEVDTRIARILTVGFANMIGVHHTETCTYLCCEDREYRSLIKKFNKYLCEPLQYNSPLIKCGKAAKYILKYRKVANELGLNGVSPSVEKIKYAN